MSKALDRPIWNALSSLHAPVSEGGGFARRYRPDIHPFACSRDDSPESMAALAALCSPGDTQIFLQADPVVLPPAFATTMMAEGVQMVADSRLPQPDDPRIEKLDESDAADMLALATLTKPGPFTMHALALGDFWGIRDNGRLVAMAGERLKMAGMTELSGVCTHPDFRGRGIGRLMTLCVAGRVFAAGDQPFLHTFAANATAIALYEKIGFRLRRRMHVAVAERRA